MEKINILMGSEITTEKVNRLLDGAIKFYGPKYEHLILKTVREALFCEYESNKSIYDILLDISKTRNDIKNIKLNLDFNNLLKLRKIGACFVVNRSAGKNEQIIITRNSKTDEDYHILAHELFGHAICGKEKSIVEQEENIYQRNGISLMEINGRDNRYIYSNEGYMEFIASNITKLSGIKDIRSKNYGYKMSKYCASQIISLLGKDTVIDSLVTYEGKLVEKNIKNNYDMKQIESLLKCLCMISDSKNFSPIRKQMNKKILNNLDSINRKITR